MAIDQALLDSVYSGLDIEVFLRELNPKEKGDRYTLDCPECGKHEAWIYKNGAIGRIFCNRKENCPLAQDGKGLSLWDYLQQREGLSQQETLKRLAEEAGVPLPSLSEDDMERIKKHAEERDLLEVAYEYFKDLLFSEEGKETLSYLHGRGYTDHDIKAMGLGYFPGSGKTLAYLSKMGYSINPVPSPLDLISSRSDYKVIFPYRDPSGRIKTFYGRPARKIKKGEAKYLNFGHIKKDTPFNMDQSRGKNTLVVVEGYLDALISQARRIPEKTGMGVIAVAGCSLSGAHLEVLKEQKVKNLVLVLDMDKAGQTGIERAIKKIQQEAPSIMPFVVTLPSGKDPDEVITQEGDPIFREYLNNAEPGPLWLSHRILDKHPLNTSLGQKQAKDELFEYMEIVPSSQRTQVMEVIGERLDYPLDDVEEDIKHYLHEQDRLRLDKAYTQAIQEASTLARNGEAFKAKDLLREKLKSLERAEQRARGEDLPEPYSMDQLIRDLQRAPEGLNTGFKTLDEVIGIPRGAITVIAGRPGHGKTTFQLNLLLNMANMYPDKKFYFFSYEEDRQWLGLKILMMQAEYTLDYAKNMKGYWKYLAGNKRDIPEIEEAKRQVDSLLESERINLIYRNEPADRLSDMIQRYVEKEDVGAVFVDYIQKIPAPLDSRYWSAQQKIQQALEVMRDTAVNCNIPLIMGAQLKRFTPGNNKGKQENRDNKELAFKLENLRESGDIEQDANLVLGVYNDSSTRADEGEYIGDDFVIMDIGVLKNRNGRTGIRKELSFYNSYFKLKDQKKAW